MNRNLLAYIPIVVVNTVINNDINYSGNPQLVAHSYNVLSKVD